MGTVSKPSIDRSAFEGKLVASAEKARKNAAVAGTGMALQARVPLNHSDRTSSAILVKIDDPSLLLTDCAGRPFGVDGKLRFKSH